MASLSQIRQQGAERQRVGGGMWPNTNTALALACDGACNRFSINKFIFPDMTRKFRHLLLFGNISSEIEEERGGREYIHMTGQGREEAHCGSDLL